MKNAFIFHGTAGSPDGNWFPWLKKQLEAKGIPTTVPRFPTPEGESLAAWFEVLDAEGQKVNGDSLLVGHSKGGMFLLKVLERLKEPVEVAVFVSAPVGERPILYYDADKKFSNFEFDWDKIRGKAKRFVVFHSDDDPYVSLANGERLAKELGVELTFIPKAGHINAESGYTELPPILEALDNEVKGRRGKMQDQKQFWDKAHKNSIIAAHSTKQTSFAEEVSKVLTPQSKILELGCGEGNDSIYLAEQGHEVIATDVAKSIIDKNSERYNHPKLSFVQQDISQPFAFPDASFDAVYARLSLHYFTNEVTRKVFAEIARVLKPGGKLCFMCKSTEDRLYGKGKQIEPDMFESDHVRHFFSEVYTKDLLKQGFTIETLESGHEEIYGKTSGFVKVVAARS